MNIKDPSSSKDQINYLSGSESGSSVSEPVRNDSEQGTEKINKIKIWHQRTKIFYPRPTPPDLQFEERKPQRNMYSNDFIYDWNIDGLSEYEIFNVLRQMTMASTTYLTDGDDHNVVQLILVGFSGTLKYWWKNCLNDKERFYV